MKTDTRHEIENAVLPPEATDAEEMLLGTLLLDPEQITAVIAEKVAPKDFFIVSHGWIYEAMHDLFIRGDAIDMTTVAERLRDMSRLEEIGGALELSRLVTLPTGYGVNAGAYAVIIRRKSEERALLEFYRRQSMMIQNNPAVSTVDKWAQGMDGLQALRPVDASNDLLLGRDAMTYLDRVIEADIANPLWYYVPYKSLTAAGASVYKPGDIVIVGGGFGSGKSAFVLQWGQHLAEIDERRVLVAFTEMDKQNVLMRRLARNSSIPYTKLLTPEKLTPDELAQYYRENYALGEWTNRVDLWECGALSAKTFVAELRDKVLRYRHDVVIVDGFNDLTFDVPRGDNQAGAIHNFMAYMETFARDMNILVIATVQLNDDGQSLGSRAYERKAALYLKLRTETSTQEETLSYDGVKYGTAPGEYSIRRIVEIAKNRRGPTGRRVRMPFIGPRFKWVDSSEIYDPALASAPAFADGGGHE